MKLALRGPRGVAPVCTIHRGCVSGLVFSRSPDLYFILFHIEIIEMCVGIEMHAHLDRVSGRGPREGGRTSQMTTSCFLGARLWCWYDLLLSVTA